MSTASTRSAQPRRPMNPQQSVSQIEKSVTHLLVATKQLLETLTQWSRKTASDGDVSDVYVRLGYEFNIACRAFHAIGIPTDDLGPVPELLRSILEETLSHDASQASLDEYLPRIRDIIINLLHGLKRKQAKLRSGRVGRDSATSTTLAGGAEDDAAGAPSGDVANRTSSGRSSSRRTISGDNGVADGPGLPPRTSSASGRSSPSKTNGANARASNLSSSTRDTAQSDSSSSLSSNAAQNIPVITPYPPENAMPTTDRNLPPTSYSEGSFPPPPPPPVKQQDALAALQRGGELERRASRRFSAYQIQKHLGASPGGIPMIPPSQNTPIPNRGREARESLNAVRNRGSALQDRPRSALRSPTTPATQSAAALTALEGNSKSNLASISPSQAQELPADEPRPPPTSVEPARAGQDESPVKVSATITAPFDDPSSQIVPEELRADKEPPAAIPKRSSSRKAAKTPVSASAAPQFFPDQSPEPGLELTLFLQYKSKIKKFVLPDGYNDLSIGRLQLAFIEKFAWNTHSNGIDLPEIYIQDPVSGVRHELEDLTDIKDRCVLVLNVEQLDEVKRHFDEGMGDLRKAMQSIKSTVDQQQAGIQRVSDQQRDAAKEIASLSARPGLASAPATRSQESVTGAPRALVDSKGVVGQLNEVQSLRRDLAVVRQTYQSFVNDIQSSMGQIRSKAKLVKSATLDASIPKGSESDSGRAFISGDKKKLSDECETTLSRVEDLQDIVEDLRKDVVTRGVRPLPRQLETVDRDISAAYKDVRRLQDAVKQSTPKWKRVWERELQLVCEEQEALSMQEALMADLSNDLEDSSKTFALVQEATRQQNLIAGQSQPGGVPGTAGRTASGKINTLVLDQAADPRKAKDSMLGEVRALQINHEERVEAIERAERARQRELEGRSDGAFQRELGNFVTEGKLKKSGGVEETDRLRKAKDERNRKEAWEDKAARERAREEKRRQKAEKAAAAAAATTAGEPGQPEGGDTGPEAASHNAAGMEQQQAGGQEAIVNGSESTTP